MYCQRRRSKLRWTSSSSLRQCSWLARVTAHTLKRPNRSSSMERNTNPYKNEQIITSLSQNILNQALAQHNIDPEKSEMIDIDLRDKIEMDEIQAYMKEVTSLKFCSCFLLRLTRIFLWIAAYWSVHCSEGFHWRSLPWWGGWYSRCSWVRSNEKSYKILKFRFYLNLFSAAKQSCSLKIPI